MTGARAIGAAIATSLAVPLALAGCAPTPESFYADVRAAVVASDPVIDDAFVTGATGIAGQTARVRIYVTSTEHDDLVRAIDAALKATLASAPVRPPQIGLDVALAPMPSDPSIVSDNLDIEDAARELGLYEGFLSDDVIRGATERFEERYGTWEELHE